MNSFPNVCLLFVILSLLSGACAPMDAPADPLQSVTALGLGATAANLARTASGATGTLMRISPDAKTVLLAWPSGTQNYGFFAMGNKAGLVQPVDTLKVMMNGNKTNTMTFSSFLKDLENAGWKSIGPEQLPAPIAIALQSAKAWLTTMASINVVLPIFILPIATPYDNLAPMPPL